MVTDLWFPINGIHGDRSKTLKCNISASNKARDMRFSVFAFKIRALYGPKRWIPSEIMAKYGQNTHTSPTPYAIPILYQVYNHNTGSTF